MRLYDAVAAGWKNLPDFMAHVEEVRVTGASGE